MTHPTTQAEALASCPFCGNAVEHAPSPTTPIIHHPPYDRHCCLTDRFFTLAAWNRRPALSQPIASAGDDRLVDVARRNLRHFIGIASFKCEVDRTAAINCLDVIEEAAISRPAVEDWQPIESAPTQETVLVAGGDVIYPVTASWSGLSDEPWQIDGQEDIHGEIGWPTHWMPTPTPPQQKD